MRTKVDPKELSEVVINTETSLRNERRKKIVEAVSSFSKEIKGYCQQLTVTEEFKNFIRIMTLKLNYQEEKKKLLRQGRIKASGLAKVRYKQSFISLKHIRVQGEKLNGKL